MGILDELKKLTHPYDDEDEEYEEWFSGLFFRPVGSANKDGLMQQ